MQVINVFMVSMVPGSNPCLCTLMCRFQYKIQDLQRLCIIVVSTIGKQAYKVKFIAANICKHHTTNLYGELRSRSHKKSL